MNLLLAACHDDGAIDITSGDIAVTKTLFRCTGAWAGQVTPCTPPGEMPADRGRRHLG